MQSGSGLLQDPRSYKLDRLIARVALGDRDSFRTLYGLTSAKLFGVLLRLLKDRAEAEDVLQDAYIKVWRRADSFGQSGNSAMAWLVAIARNSAIDRIRARKPVDVLDEQPEIADGAPTPEALAMASSMRRQIDACLDELDTARATAVRGAYLDGDSYETLAVRHGVPLNTMRTWLRRSLMKLKECLER